MTTATATTQATDFAAFWGEPIHVYTREEAIEDGVLVDAQVGDLRDVTRQHMGNQLVTMTAAVFALMEKAVANPRYGNDFCGVWADICWMRNFPDRVYNSATTRTRLFRVIITGAGRKRYHTLKLVENRVGNLFTEATFMLPEED